MGSHSYHLKTRTFAFDSTSNHRRQCFRSLYQFTLCLESIDDDTGQRDMVLEVISPDSIEDMSVSGTESRYSHAFEDDRQWDSVSKIMGLSKDETVKCTHHFESRICLERSVSSQAIVSYVASVYIHEVELSK